MARNPPPEQPIRTFPSPDITDQVVLEWVTSEFAASQPVAPGTAHPNTRDFSGFKLGKQIVNPQDHNFFIRYYVKDQPSPDTFSPAWNYALKYSGQSNSHPVVIRAYRKLKSGYTPLARGTALADFPGAFLIEEEAAQFPTDSEFFALYFNVVRVYETLPGPYIPFTRYDENLGPIQGRRRAVLYSNQVTTLGATSKKTYEGRDGSSIVAWEIEENWSDGTGSAGNPAYPILKTDFNDPDRGPVHQTSQITTDTTSAGSSTESGGVVTTIRYEPYQDNPNLRKKIIETWSVPRALAGKDTNEAKQVVTVTETRKAPGSDATPTATKDVRVQNMGDGTVKQTEREVPAVFDKDTRNIEIPDVAPAWAKALLPTTNTSSEAAGNSISDPTLSTGQLRKTVRRTTEKTVQTEITARDIASLPKTRTNKRLTTEFGGGAVDEVQTQATGSQSISSGGLLVLDSEMEVLGDGTSVLKTSTQTDGSWPILYDYDIDPETGQTILTSYQVVAAGTAATATSASGVVTRYKHIDKWRSLKIIATYSTPADYDEQRFGAHNFPTLWDGDYTWTPECGAFAPGLRGAFSAMVQMRTTVSHTTTKQTISGLTLIPNTILVGRGWQMPQDLIMDSGFITYSGECTGTITFGASDPDYSTYTGSIQGTEQLITGESVRTQSGLYRNTEVYVTML